MPIYEYECAQCAKVHEISQRMSDEPIKVCPECGGSVKKIMSRTSFALKGTGYYSTDYKKPSAPAPATTAVPAPATTAVPAPAAPAATPAASSTPAATPAATPVSPVKPKTDK